MKPNGVHRGCSIINDIERTELAHPRIIYESTYQNDYSDRNRNVQLSIFSTAPMYNPYTWTTFSDVMKRRPEVKIDRDKVRA